MFLLKKSFSCFVEAHELEKENLPDISGPRIMIIANMLMQLAFCLLGSLFILFPGPISRSTEGMLKVAATKLPYRS